MYSFCFSFLLLQNKVVNIIKWSAKNSYLSLEKNDVMQKFDWAEALTYSSINKMVYKKAERENDSRSVKKIK